ncbi:MAG: YHS domain-containing protein [Deltaproteobacteria bacterium]|nr:YHS domain-containing protein [Deltaproteobacteria bacterium]
MYRLLITVIGIYLLYRVLRWAMTALGSGAAGPTIDRGSGSTSINEMVKDPVCGTYVLARDSIHVRTRGQTYYFCSDECRKRFLSS